MQFTRASLLALCTVAFATAGLTVCTAAAAPAKSKKRETGSAKETSAGASREAILTDAPSVPPRITRRHPMKLVVELEVSEVNLPMASNIPSGPLAGKFLENSSVCVKTTQSNFI
jgi:hypothetical protein